MTIPPGKKTAIDYVQWFDYATMKAKGITVALRYLANVGTLDKALKPADRDALHANGIAIICMMERNKDAPSKGYNQGLIDGQIAVKAATAIGYPEGLPIIIAVDTDIITPTLIQALGYVQGFNAVIDGRWTLGVYGDSDILNACASISVCNHLSNARSWSGALQVPITFLQYYNSHATEPVDYNDILIPVTAWLPNEVSDPAAVGDKIVIDSFHYLTTPERRYDSRDPKGPNPFLNGEKRYVYLGADAENEAMVIAHVEAVGGAGNLRFWDGSGDVPNINSVGYVGGYGQSLINAPLVTNPNNSQKGHVCIYASSMTHVVIDVVGFAS